MFDTFPSTAQDAQDWLWPDYAPFAESLRKMDLNEANLNSFMNDWTRFGKMIWEVYARNNVATTIDTTDEAAEKRYLRFMSEVYPEVMKLNNDLNQKLVASGLTPANFEVPMRAIRSEIELFRDKNLPLMTELQELSLQYDKISGAQSVEWNGEERTLAKMKLVQLNKERDVREKAWRSTAIRTLQDRESLNDLWQKLLTLRTEIARNADKANYREYAWQERGRFDYSPEDAQSFFHAIEEVVVPAAERLYERKRKALGVETLRPWDLEVETSEASALHPFEKADELIAVTSTIFNKIDPQLGAYFDTMRDENLLDLDNRKGKAPGGYCTDFPVVERPFIFMNAVGLHDDVQTMLHESGHAFHAFECMKLDYVQQMDIPMEFAEVASMSMELIAAPYLEKSEGGFYDEADAARARIEHLEGLIRFWPYMAVVSSFQHWVYTHEGDAIDPQQCDAKWAELWSLFMKGIDWTGLEDWVNTGWHRKLHIFHLPFYYIEYGLAQLGAVQIWANSLKDHRQALEAYIAALQLGNTATLPQLFETAGAKFAFDSETLGTAVDLIERTIEELEAV
ncbi:M3 family oligoendopeptidase [Anaerolineales bacterium]